MLPKYRNGQPADKVMAPPDIPKDVALAASRELIRNLVGKMSDYGLPEPDHEPLSAHPSVSADFLTKAGSGDIHMLPAIERLDGSTVHLADGSSVEADVIICATGYDMKFPFFDDAETRPAPRRRPPLPAVQADDQAGRRPPLLPGAGPVVADDRQPRRAAVQAARQAAHRHLRAAAVDEQERIMVADEQAHLEQYYAAPRHTIQIDFARYCVDLHEEIAAGRRGSARRVTENGRRATRATTIWRHSTVTRGPGPRRT